MGEEEDLRRGQTEYEDYLGELVIDKNRLDDECVESPALFDKWSRLEIVACEERDDAKARLELVRAKIELQLRGMSIAEVNRLAERWTGKPYNLKSLSEGTIKALVTISTEVQSAQRAYSAAVSRASSYTVARKSFERRHSSLDNLVRLHGQNYFGSVEGKDTKQVVVRKIRKKLAAQIEKSFPKRTLGWFGKRRKILSSGRRIVRK